MVLNAAASRSESWPISSASPTIFLKSIAPPVSSEWSSAAS